MNWECPDVQAGFQRGRLTRDQIANIHWIMEKPRESRKNIYFRFIVYAKAFDCVDHNQLWKTLQEMGIPDHLTCLLRNLYVDQEATVRILHGKTGSKLRNEYSKAVYCHSVYLTYMQSTSCEMLAGWIPSWNWDCWRNISNLRYAYDTTLMAESEEELNSLLMMVKENEKASLKFNIQKTRNMASSPITPRQIVGGKVEAVMGFIS